MSEPSLNVKLFGTEESPQTPHLLTAGSLTAELDSGNLRYIRYGGVEVIRGISFIVRDSDWGTFAPTLSGLQVEEGDGQFEVTYSAQVRNGDQVLAYRVRIVGSEASLRFSAVMEAETDFVTNRAGFVVLHPLDGVAGAPVTIEHVDGRVEEGRFPEAVEPFQPMKELRALTHEPVPGVAVACRMEGDTFEMEDQRNWTDASYKTYVRPLALPWPYTLEKGESSEQSVTLEIKGRPGAGAADSEDIRVDLGERGASVPRLGVGLSVSELEATQRHVEDLRALGPRQVVFHFDPREASVADLGRAAEIVGRLNAGHQDPPVQAWLEVVVAEVEGYAAELASLGARIRELGSPFDVVLVSPAADLKGTLPGSPWPPAPEAPELYAAARRAFPDVRLGGGMFSFFTELNRKRPPLDDLDCVQFTTSAIVHAGDDRTVMEGIEALPFISATARSIADGLPVVVGPSAIGMRLNPYGAAPMNNPGNIRQAMNENDPRQRGLLGAAWTVAYFAQFARGGARTVTFGGVTGPHGVVHHGQPWPQPYFDAEGGLFPVFHVERCLAALADQRLRETRISDPRAVQCVVAETDGGYAAVLANLTPEAQTVRVPFDIVSSRVLDADAFVAASHDPAFLDAHSGSAGTRQRSIRLEAYAVASLSGR
ncbi:hypothetical protein KBTX_02636 [wastewater metagenome]|uniref:Uncharacterized protein n=2 Tax=unclassified sequences TaxID=12908 RepID=A0A5B8RFL2_9ZZZZ|nr:hypothetical protein KBTEX_02636 [uncultured organism]